MEGVGSTRVTTGVGSVSRAARWEADSHGRLLRPTLPDDVVSIISPEMRYLLDFELTQITDKIHDFTAREFYVAKMGTTSSPNQYGNRKLTRSQIDVHKISFATAHASCNLQ